MAPILLLAQEAPRAPASEKFVLKVEKPRFADIVIALQKSTNLNVLADCYTDDLVIGGIDLLRSSRQALVAQAAAVFGREVIAERGVTILRHPRWLIYTPAEPHVKPLLPNRWEQDARSEARVLDPHAYPLRFALIARERPLGEVAAALARVSGWQLRLPPLLRDRRVTVAFGDMTAGEAVDALAVLVNYSGQVTLFQTRHQKAAEERWLAVDREDTAGRPLQRRLSEELKPQLLELMTPEQRAVVSAGGQVLVRVSDMPPRLQSAARRYADVGAGLLSKLPASDIDWTRFREFQIAVDLQPFLGVRGFFKNGRGIGY